MKPPEKPISAGVRRQVQGWRSSLARFSLILIGLEIVTGFIITFLEFSSFTQWNILAHTLLGLLMSAPVGIYLVRHVVNYRSYGFNHHVLLGHVAAWSLLVCCISGLILTWQGLFSLRTEVFWRQLHLVSTVATLVGLLPHILLVAIKALGTEAGVWAKKCLTRSALGVGAAVIALALLARLYPGQRYHNEFPNDYSFIYGEDRPFAPSLAKTDTGSAFDERSLAGSMSCGTVGCHEQILEEWQPSAHRYAAMDTIFQGIQQVMAKQNGPESTRYCGGCHDPISLFSGAKNIFVDDLTGLHGYQEGISCLACHAIRETDVQGNANYTVTQPREYLWQWQEQGLGRIARDFLIRTYPEEHNQLSKRMFKKPEYCAACHKQFIDQEVNRVGWVQLQNQYDNWAASHWNHKTDPSQTVECRECHMPLVDSRDPASGDTLDPGRNAKDGKHRSHRFIASNQVMPMMLKLPGWEKQVQLTEEWLQGKTVIPEISHKWSEGPIVKMALQAPETIQAGRDIPLRVVMASNKVGHDFPTGPLDIIQSWLEIHVKDAEGREIYTSGTTDQDHFLEAGTFLFKAEPVDQHGNLIDRHNLWEMVGVRFRRALFPGYSDTVQFTIPCSGSVMTGQDSSPTESTGEPEEKSTAMSLPAIKNPGSYHIEVRLNYRKVDQYLLNFLFGETNKVTSPITQIVRSETTVQVSDSLPESSSP